MPAIGVIAEPVKTSLTDRVRVRRVSGACSEAMPGTLPGDLFGVHSGDGLDDGAHEDDVAVETYAADAVHVAGQLIRWVAGDLRRQRPAW